MSGAGDSGAFGCSVSETAAWLGASSDGFKWPPLEDREILP